MATLFPLTSLPPEILHEILHHLDTPDLLQISRTSHQLRCLSLDPVLHRARRRSAVYSLSHALDNRPPRSAISPPNAWIWLSRTNVLSRSISKSLIKIRLSHNLERRPHVEDLVARAVLPAACATVAKGRVVVSPIILRRGEDVRKLRLRDKLGRKLERRPSIRSLVELNIIPEECAAATKKRGSGGTWVSPRLVETRRKVIKEGLKDGLRAWVERRAVLEQKRKAEEMERTEGLSVKALVRKLSVRGKGASDTDKMLMEKRRAQSRWARELEIVRRREEKRKAAMSMTGNACDEGCLQPTRAHVLGLKRFWEGVIQAAAG